ncbi:MAG: acyl-CoA dehydrogenase family protein [Acidimicrobiia bacterium]
MDLDFTDEQEMLAEAVAGLCEQYASLDVVRELEDDPTGYPAELWKQLGALDLLGLTLPEEYGGSGQSLLEAAIVYEQFGRALTPSPHFVSSVMSGGVLAAAGSDDQKKEWLPRIASGDAVLTTAWLEPESGFGLRGVHLEATVDGDDVVLEGSKLHVPFASSADRLLVLARTGGDDTDVDLFLVDPKTPGVTLEQQMTVASDTQYSVTFEDVRVPTADRVGAGGSGWATWDTVMHDGIVLLAAQAIGGAEAALDMTVQYAKDRHQFDKPLGAFQAIAHYLADAATTVDGGRTLVYEAAWARSEGRSIARLAPMAKLLATKTFRDVTAMAQQVFGGVGFTLEYDVQLYFRRAKQLQISWWDARYLEELVASSVLDD